MRQHADAFSRDDPLHLEANPSYNIDKIPKQMRSDREVVTSCRPLPRVHEG